MSLLDKLTDG